MYVNLNYLCKIFAVLIVFPIVLLSSYVSSFANSKNSIIATVSISVCGNGVVEDGEVCDSTIVNGKTCADFGYQEGLLLCGLACDEYNTDFCSNEVEKVLNIDENMEERDIEEGYIFEIEDKVQEFFDSVEILSMGNIPNSKIETTEFVLTGINHQEVHIIMGLPPP